MNILREKHFEFIQNLITAEIDFLIIGGYAVIYHGYVRNTGDLDIWLKPSNENKEKLLPVLRKHGIREEDLAHLLKSDFSKPVSFYIGEMPLRIEFLTSISGVSFNKAEKEKDFLTVNNMNIPFLNISNLILNKMLTGRLRDKADAEELHKILLLRKKKK